MTVDEIGSICIMGLVAITVSGALISHLHEEGYTKTFEACFKKHFKFYYLIPVTAAIVITSAYVINVGFDPEDTKSAHYGQMGDFFWRPIKSNISVYHTYTSDSYLQHGKRNSEKGRYKKHYSHV